VVLALMSAIFAAALVGVTSISSASRQAVDDGTTGDQAGRRFVVQSGAQLAGTVLASSSGFDPIVESVGTIGFDDRLVEGSVHVVRNPDLPLASLVDGRRARGPDEVELTLAAADALKAPLGERVQVGVGRAQPEPRTVVGFVVDASDRDAIGVIAVDPDLDPASAALWVSDRDPVTVDAVREALERRTASYESLDTAQTGQDDRLPDAVRDLVPVSWALLVASGLLLLSLLLVLLPVARTDASALQAAGLSAKAAWVPIARGAAVALAVGQLVGAAAARGALEVLRLRLSAELGQYWLSIPVPWPWVVASAVVALLSVRICPSVVAVLRLAAKMRARRTERSMRPPAHSVVALIAGALILGAAAVGNLRHPPSQLTLAAPVGAVVIAGAIPGLVLRMVVPRRRSALRVIELGLARGIHGTLVIVCALITAASVHVAQVNQDTLAFEGGTRASSPPGSLLVDALPDAAAATLLSRYAHLGGARTAAYEVPLESDTQLRVTSPSLVACMRRASTLDPDSVPPDCFPTGTYSPVNTVALATTTTERSVADPGLLDGGSVGLLQFPTGSGTAAATAEAPAEADDLLGGYLPGLVVPATGEVARRFGLQPGGTEIILLLDFASLGASARASIRSDVARLGPSAQVTDASGESGYERDRTAAAGEAMAAGLLALLLLAASAAAVALAGRRTMRVLVDIGSPLRARAGLALRWASLPLVCIVAAVPVVLAAATIAGIGRVTDIGGWWLIPLVAAALAGLSMPAMLLRVPPRTGE
jgi:hypothetical protein